VTNWQESEIVMLEHNHYSGSLKTSKGVVDLAMSEIQTHYFSGDRH
jgi:hypothetical protein